MKNAFYLAWRFLGFYRGRTVLISVALGTLIALPFGLRLLLNQAEYMLASRTADTKLLLGARASALDLVMNSFYFSESTPPLITLADADAVRDFDDAADAIPMYVRFRARGRPIVGTTIDYFEHRALEFGSGRPFTIIGEAVIGAEVARELQLNVGDTLVTEPENAFDLAGVYPLQVAITGILKQSNSPDDGAIFVDIKTAWIIEGLGHGHQDLQEAAADLLLPDDTPGLTANAKLPLFRKIDAGNIADFHFHGDPANFPLTAVMMLSDDERAAALLRGRYLEEDSRQLLVPGRIVDGLLDKLLRLRRFIDGIFVIVMAAAALLLILVYALSLRLRDGEFTIMTHLGAPRGAKARLVFAELTLIGALSLMTAGLGLLGVTTLAQRIVESSLL